MIQEAASKSRPAPNTGEGPPNAAGEARKPHAQSLYAAHEKIYPKRVSGRFRTIKWTVLSVLLGIYYLTPWIRWDRGPAAPDQAVLIDMPGRRAYFFAVEIWPQEIYYLTGLLILGAVGLFLVTAWAGRVWCGFTCPQTVWTDLFLLVERRIEGDRNKRLKLDQGPLTSEKVLRKTAKHLVWLAISVATGGAWIFYFVDVRAEIGPILTGHASETVYGFVALFTATTYVLAGWAREQLCIYMCPWPRFQSAMFDQDSLIVTYETWRGEPRGKAPRDRDFEGRGHCVDCTLCVQACPTGIDIRDGQQLACIGCGLCIDACNGIMDQMSLPPGLITYDSISNQFARENGEAEQTRLLRPRTLVYMAILATVAVVMAISMATRETLEINIQRDRSPLYVTLSSGDIRNGYTYKVLNMIREPRRFELSVRGIEGARITVIGVAPKPVTTAAIDVRPDRVGTFRVFVHAPGNAVGGRSRPVSFALRDLKTDDTIEHESVFYGPGGR